MKPPLTIMEVRMSKLLNRNNPCLAQWSVSPYMRKTVIYVFIFLFPPLTCNNTAWAQTSIVGMRTTDTIVIGSDSIARHNDTGETMRFCKIQQFENVFFTVASSYSMNPSTGFSVWEIVGAACNEGGTIHEKMQRFMVMVEPPLKRELERLRNNRLDFYRDKIAFGDKVVLQAIMVGYENSVPVMLMRQLILSNPDALPVSFSIITNGCPGDCNPRARIVIYTMGFRDHMQEYLTEMNNKGFLRKTMLTQIAHQAIATEIGKHPNVAGDIHVLSLTRNRAVWVGPHPDCPDIQPYNTPAPRQQPRIRRKKRAPATHY